MSYDAIAIKLGRTKKTLISWAKELRAEIHNLEAIELDSLREKYCIGKKARLEMFGLLLEGLKKEFFKRDFSCLSTKELIDLIMKTNDSMLKEFGGLSFIERNSFSLNEFEDYPL